MADYRARIFNCPISGAEFTPTPQGGKVRNLTRFNAGDLKIELLQQPALITAKYGDLRGKVVESTDLIIRNLPPARLNDAEAVAHATAMLLSMATSSEVVNAGYEFDAVNPRATFRSFVGTLEYFRPAFSTARSDLLGPFLEQCLPQFQKLINVRGLNVVFDYYVLSQKQQAIELGSVTTFVLMENLKHTYAKEKGYPFIKGYFRRHGASKKKPGATKSFAGLLEEMFAAVGMKPSLQKAIKLRNEIIHSGISILNYKEQWAIYESCQDILREYILRLLGYRGEYHSFSDTTGATKKIR